MCPEGTGFDPRRKQSKVTAVFRGIPQFHIVNVRIVI
jgi:hypothetical protein